MKIRPKIKTGKIKGLALGLGLLALGTSTPGFAYCCYHHGGVGPGIIVGAAAGIITAAAIANQGYYGYYGPAYYYPYRYYAPYGYRYYGYSRYPYYRAGYNYGDGYYYAGCQRVFVRCNYHYDRNHYRYRHCYRYIRWVC